MLGDRIKFAREQFGETQAELGDALGVSQQTVANWERSRREPDAETLVAIAKRYEVSGDYLLGLTEAPRVYKVDDTLIYTNVKMTEEEQRQEVQKANEIASMTVDELDEHVRQKVMEVLRDIIG